MSDSRLAASRSPLVEPEMQFEFKTGQIGMPFVYAKNERGLILITHGFVKKRDKTPKEEITRAWRIFEEDQEQTKLAIVRKAKR